MFHKNLFCVLVISASIKLLHSAEPVRMGSTALGKGPEIPLNFTSTHTQYSSLSPIDHDVYEDARLSAVSSVLLNRFDFTHNLFYSNLSV